RDGTGEEPEEEKHAAHRLDDTRDTRQGGDGDGAAPGNQWTWHRKELPGAELDEQEPGNDAEDAEQLGRPRAPAGDDVLVRHGTSSRGGDSGGDSPPAVCV